MTEISTICQKFLGQNIQNEIPHTFHIHHFLVRAPEMAELKKFCKNGRNFCHMPEISRSEYSHWDSASFLYWAYISHKQPQPAKLKNREAKWQKFLPYGRNFYISISGIKFLTYHSFIIFLSEHNLGKNGRSHGRIGGVTKNFSMWEFFLLTSPFSEKNERYPGCGSYDAKTKGDDALDTYLGGCPPLPNFWHLKVPKEGLYMIRMTWRIIL